MKTDSDKKLVKSFEQILLRHRRLQYLQETQRTKKKTNKNQKATHVSCVTYHLHFVQRVDDGAISPSVQEREDDALDLGDRPFNGRRKERSLNELLEPGVISPLVKEDSVRSDHPLFARGIRRLEQVRLAHQHHPRRLRARHHHARAPQYVRLEHVPVPDTRTHTCTNLTT